MPIYKLDIAKFSSESGLYFLWRPLWLKKFRFCGKISILWQKFDFWLKFVFKDKQKTGTITFRTIVVRTNFSYNCSAQLFAYELFVQIFHTGTFPTNFSLPDGSITFRTIVIRTNLLYGTFRTNHNCTKSYTALTITQDFIKRSLMKSLLC